MATFDRVLRGGVLWLTDGPAVADVGIKDGTIVEIGDLKQASASEIVKVEGLAVLPGMIDTQVHFREPGMEHKEDLESGSRAALYGGVTTFFEMPNTSPTTTSREALDDKLSRAKGRCWANYGFFVGASNDNIDQLRELELLPGTPGIKIFMGSSTGPLLVEGDENLRRVLENGSRPCPIHAEDEPRLRELKNLLSEHPHPREHPHVRDAEAARLATSRILALSRETGRPVHILHVSTADELTLIDEAKRHGLRTTAEATPQHLYFNEELYERRGTRAQMNPPIRSEEHRRAIFEALVEGLFDVLGSDHAPHTLDEKAKPYPQSPSGMPGVQTIYPFAMRLVAEGHISAERMLQLCCENPCAIYGIKGKGRIAVGYDADLVVCEPSTPFTVENAWFQSKCGWSAWEGEMLYGKPIHVLVNGTFSLREGSHVGSPSGCAVEYDWKPVPSKV
ncbi:MAG: dihydroorotase [Armatimonadetes bacterium]|nr:dihydroorotase [Armatimonadota bacterium]